MRRWSVEFRWNKQKGKFCFCWFVCETTWRMVWNAHSSFWLHVATPLVECKQEVLVCKACENTKAVQMGIPKSIPNLSKIQLRSFYLLSKQELFCKGISFLPQVPGQQRGFVCSVGFSCCTIQAVCSALNTIEEENRIKYQIHSSKACLSVPSKFLSNTFCKKRQKGQFLLQVPPTKSEFLNSRIIRSNLKITLLSLTCWSGRLIWHLLFEGNFTWYILVFFFELSRRYLHLFSEV